MINKISWLKKRDLNAHKNDFGHVAVLAGSRNMPGAGVLVANTAMKCGSGLVTKFQISSSNALCIPEVMYCFLEDGGAGCFTSEMAPQIIASLARATVLVVGPGLGNEKTTAECVYKVLGASNIPTVIDASALNYLSENQELKLPKETILTPHYGEGARLLHCSVAEIENDKLKSAEEISKKYHSVVVLKGAETIVCDARGEETEYFNLNNPNPYLATAGSGDVLAGIISACLAQGLPPFEAAKLAVYAHNMAGVKAHAIKKSFIVASDIIDYCDLEGDSCK